MSLFTLQSWLHIRQNRAIDNRETDTNSQRSNLQTFTMRLIDRFHSPKPKRVHSSKKASKPSIERTVKAPEKQETKSLSWLEEKEKEVVSALRYFKTIIDKMVVDRKVLEMLPGSASKVLEAIVPVVQIEPKILKSSSVSSCLSRVYQSLANLIRWSDQVMLEGVDLEEKDTVANVTSIIKAVLDGVKELVKLVLEKGQLPSPTSPVAKNIPSVISSESVPEPPVIQETEDKNSTNSSALSPSTVTLTDAPSSEEAAPPKPPLPGLKVPEHCPPALPPKKRQSAPSPTRVAVVVPMSRATSGSSLPIGICRQDYDTDGLHRRFSGGSHSYGGESPRGSPCGSMGKLSKSDEQLSSLEQDSGQCSRNTSCETLDTAESYDPDYDFLREDLSSVDQISLPPSSCLSPLPESHREPSSSPCPGHVPYGYPSLHHSIASPLPHPLITPPALPEKKRRSGNPQTPFNGLASRTPFERLHSHYDNVTDDEMPVPPFPLFPIFAPVIGYTADFVASENASLPQSPPPLPEKKSRHILKYMQFVEDYSEPQPSVFYQTPQSESIYEQRNKLIQEVYGFNDSFSSSDSVHEPLPPPALPPKQRQLASSHSASPSSSSSSSLSCQLQPVGGPGSAEADTAFSLSASSSSLGCPASPPAVTDPNCSLEDSLQDSVSNHSKEPAESDSWKQKCADSDMNSDELDELSLVDHQEIMARITLKQENDDGPDVRAGSEDILLVHATETDRKDLFYTVKLPDDVQDFLTPEDLIKRLYYRSLSAQFRI
ncbi:Rap guanine nucleotide exchange factor 1 [Bagarius yarrelli]|uniref:Rap guanine nucleotide exchange factor 1 n=1 Tax=Bagarius yarrelli TaxID=175774 RepID=A0A556UFM4_BAGYA|nr:Rap guanine nucleotide exchange factor 1 [Bagarius yarrelli]